MKPQHAYQQSRHVGVPRVDMILSLYDEVCDRLQRAQQGDAAAKSKCLTEAKIIVSGLALGVDAASGELGSHFIRLYEFVLHCLASSEPRFVDALEVMQILREGFHGARAQALTLERNGVIPPLDRNHSIQAMV